MPFTHTVGATYKSNAGTVSSTTKSYTGDTEAGVDATVEADSTAEFEIGFARADVSSFLLYSDQPVTVTIEAQGTVLAAKQAVIWTSDSVGALSEIVGGADVASVSVENEDLDNDAKFKMRVLLNTE